jgi:excisionase family DNA binding protein
MKFLTTEQAAERLGCSSRTVRRWIHKGNLDGVRLGRDLFVLDSKRLAERIAMTQKEESE